MSTTAPATTDATRDTTEALLSRQGVALEVAASRLGVSLRTVQRHVKSGKLRSIEGDSGRLVLLDGAGEAEATGDATPRQLDATRPISEATERQSGATGDTPTPNSEVAMLRQMLEREREMNGFLRAQIEEGNRNAAELRTSLREALKAMPKQLTAPSGGLSESQQNSTKTDLERESAKYGEIRQDTAEKAPARDLPDKKPEEPGSGTQRRQWAPSSLGELADLLEIELEK